MKITLLNNTPPEILLEALKMPYDSKNMTMKSLKSIWNNGHRSFARMGIATFKVEGVSQSLLRQLSRHPHLNLQVKSTRYCDMKNTRMYIPDNIKSLFSKHDDFYNYIIFDDEGEDEITSEFHDDLKNIMEIYDKWKTRENDLGLKEPDVSKLLLPLASTTDLIISANYQAWYEFLQLRNCLRAEKEIRMMSYRISETLMKLVPEIFEDIDCKAAEIGYCTEFKPCGKYPTKLEVVYE